LTSTSVCNVAASSYIITTSFPFQHILDHYTSTLSRPLHIRTFLTSTHPHFLDLYTSTLSRPLHIHTFSITTYPHFLDHNISTLSRSLHIRLQTSITHISCRRTNFLLSYMMESPLSVSSTSPPTHKAHTGQETGSAKAAALSKQRHDSPCF